MKINLKSAPVQMAVIFIILVILSLVYVRSCRPHDTDPATRTVDSLTRVNREQQIKFDRYVDSTTKANRVKDSIIRRDSLSLVKSRNEVRKSTEIASYYARRYDSAKQALDTSAQLEYCDSLRWQIATINQAVDSFNSDVAVLVTGLYESNAGLKTDLAMAHERISQQNQTIENLNSVQGPIVDENLKLKKQLRSAKKWGNRKMFLGAGLGAVIRGLFK